MPHSKFYGLGLKLGMFKAVVNIPLFALLPILSACSMSINARNIPLGSTLNQNLAGESAPSACALKTPAPYALAVGGGNGTILSYDYLTGAQSVIGTITGVFGLGMGQQLYLNQAKNKLFLVAFDSSFNHTLFSYDLVTHLSAVEIPVIPSSHANASWIGIDAQDNLVGMIWTGTQEDVVSINTNTLALSTLGTLTGLNFTTGSTSMDCARKKLYLSGSDSGGDPYVYTFDLDSRITKVIPNSVNLTYIAAVVDEQTIYGLSWNGSQEEVSKYDITGAIVTKTTLGTLTGFSFWSGESSFNYVTNELFAVDSSGTLYRFDVLNSSFLGATPATAVSALTK